MRISSETTRRVWCPRFSVSSAVNSLTRIFHTREAGAPVSKPAYGARTRHSCPFWRHPRLSRFGNRRSGVLAFRASYEMSRLKAEHRTGLSKRFFGAAALLLLACSMSGQTATNTAAPGFPEAATNSWSFSAYINTYLVPDSRDYVNPVFTADRNWLHLEARYNYEALETGSLWLGYNFSFGQAVTLAVTPMLGGVFGDLTGVAPGYTVSLSWRRFSLYTQGEYVFDTGNSSGSFFYTWSELSYSPVDWFRVGFAVQRTKLYQTNLDFQRGFLVGFNYKSLDFTSYVFNLGWTDPTLVFAVGVQF